MTIILVAALAVFAVVAVVIFFLSKSKGNSVTTARYYKTEDLSENSIKQRDDTPSLNADNSGKRNNGTAVLTPDMENPTGINKAGSGGENTSVKKNNGTAVLHPEDDPFSNTEASQSGSRQSTGRRGTEVLKSDNGPAATDSNGNPASADRAEGKAPPTELLEDLPVEEQGGGLFSKHVYKKVWLQRPRTKDRIELKSEQFVIGRESGLVDLCLEDNLSVSRNHATIKRKGADYYIVDNGSLNRTFVNNVKVEEGKEVKLKNRDRIMIGDEPFTFIVR